MEARAAAELAEATAAAAEEVAVMAVEAAEAAEVAAAIEAAEAAEAAAAAESATRDVAARAAAAEGGGGADELQRQQLDALIDRLADLQSRGMEGSPEYGRLCAELRQVQASANGCGADESKVPEPMALAPIALHGSGQGGGAASLPPLPRPASPVGATRRSALCVMLQQHGLQHHAVVLEQNGVMPDNVGELTSSDLKEIGIAMLMERKALLKVFKAHAEGAAEGRGGAAAAAPSPAAPAMSAAEHAIAMTSSALSCNICMETFELPPSKRTPKALPCQHSFCESCLLAHARGAASLECPTCREMTQLPGGRVDGLKNNFAVLEILEQLLSALKSVNT